MCDLLSLFGTYTGSEITEDDWSDIAQELECESAVLKAFAVVESGGKPSFWRLHIALVNRELGQRGALPDRSAWLVLPKVLEGSTPPKGWLWQRTDAGWRLENRRTGEWLEGYLSP